MLDRKPHIAPERPEVHPAPRFGQSGSKIKSVLPNPVRQQFCSCCGQLIVPEVVLPPVKQRIFETVSRRPGIDAENLRALVWADDPGGGPEDRKVLHVHVHQLNQRLTPLGIAVRGHPSNGYRVVSLGGVAS